MSDKDLRYSEKAESLMDSLCQTYKSEKINAVEECQMCDTAIAYASGELELEENQKFRDHLHTCHFCLNLVLDFKVAESESENCANRPATVLPALSRAIKKPKTRKSFYLQLKKLPALISETWSLLVSPKMIATLATICFAFIFIYYGLNNFEMFNQIEEINKKIAKQKNQSKQPDLRGSDVPTQEEIKTETPSAKSPKYIPQGKIDPFDPLFQKKKGVVRAKKRRLKKRIPRTPLEKFDLSQLKLVGVIMSPDGNKALVEDSSGKGYTLSKGTYIGINAGKVVEIQRDRIIIEEELEDATGNVTIQRKELKLNK